MVAATLGIVVAAEAPIAQAEKQPLPSVLTCAGKTVVRPTSYVLSCADANTYFNSVHWTTWTSRSATATATFVQNNCIPTCADGKFMEYPAKVTLSEPKSTQLGLLFSVVHYSYTVPASADLPLTRLSGVQATGARPKCSNDPKVAAEYIIPPSPFKVSGVVAQQTAMPPSQSKGKGTELERLYQVSFEVVHGNPVLPAGHRYTQFAYVERASSSAEWCFFKGGSGP
jgi:hypothetical protein